MIMNSTIQNAIFEPSKPKVIQESIEYCSIIEIEQEDPLILNISGQGVMPEFKISQQCFQFGECPVNDHRDIQFTLQNMGIQQLEITTQRNCYFVITPNQATLPVNQKLNLIATFNPRSAGTILSIRQLPRRNYHSNYQPL